MPRGQQFITLFNIVLSIQMSKKLCLGLSFHLENSHYFNKKVCIQDGNGYIDRHELATMLRFLGEPVTEEEIHNLIEEADANKDGLIDYSEFYTMMCAKKPARTCFP